MVAESQRRARPGRPKVVAEAALLDAAALLADDGGLESVTFRALAEVLGVSAMAVHRASGGIDALRHRLIAVVVDEAINDIAWPEGDWRGTVETFARGLRDLLLRHPLVLEAHSRAALDTPAADDVAHRVVRALREGGLDAEHAAYGYAAVHDFVTGHVAIRLGRGELELLDIPPARRAASVFDSFHDVERRFQVGLGLLLDGLAVAAERRARA
ncbi:TetR/AcrR family transcriptional regulator C-terminal domain-containing protein [Microbacterium saperdae]|uniref:TetR family transcriptional regulator n=1 Tax=Microbacterium saperdae TaxID=69368 RepID=A0A543BIU2_9MICO|nr:TetR/AcrR family transcriptional regulator C-terminal domain-containing protein [Microbacterium saperdae]TQL84769.1 TetR family transcriptional regulator [Microbacterium saperdae]GGM64164.1 hypothetical protein GCM10010489_39790 [Microbacterium saperdae]